MRKTLGWTFVALLLVAVPAAAQEGHATPAGWKVPSFDELADLPILGWIVELLSDEEAESEALDSTSPTPPLGEISQLDGATDTEARGGWEPEG